MDVPEAAAQAGATAATPTASEPTTTTETWTDTPEAVTAPSDAGAVTPGVKVPSAVAFNIAAPSVVNGVATATLAARQQAKEDPLSLSMLRESFGAARYASRYDSPYGFAFHAPQGRSLLRLVPPTPESPPQVIFQLFCY